MIWTFFDLETTGLSTEQDHPVSAGWVSLDTHLYNVVDKGLLYFYNPKKEISEEAINVHGLTHEILQPYKDDYIPNCRKLFKLISRGNLIGHNARNFDYKLVTNFLLNLGFPVLPANRVEDTLAIYRPLKQGKNDLESVVNRMCGMDVVDRQYERIFGHPPKMGHHSADWDSVACMTIYKIAVRKGYCKNDYLF